MDPVTIGLIISAGEALVSYAQGVYDRHEAEISAADQAALNQRLQALNSAINAKIATDSAKLLADLQK